jgi:hypothetical protein
MVRQGAISEIEITGGEFAGNQAAKCPEAEDTTQFLRHLATELISPAPNRTFRFVNSDGIHEFDRCDVTQMTITFS